MTDIIYIPLEDEGIAVRRPAPACRRPDGKYIVLRPADYDAALEHWAFPPGSTVECDRIPAPDGTEILAAVRRAPADIPTNRQAV